MKQYILGLTIVLFLFCFGTYAAEYSDSKLGKALILVGSSHTVKIPHYAGLKPAKAITISAWIKPERGGNVEVVFDHVGGGLIKKAFQIEDVKTTSAKLEGFELSADGHRYFPAEATIQGDQVVVSSAAVKSPKHVRYAWTGFPKANLFNKGDLPAHPFRTDDHVPQSPVEQKK